MDRSIDGIGSQAPWWSMRGVPAAQNVLRATKGLENTKKANSQPSCKLLSKSTITTVGKISRNEMDLDDDLETGSTVHMSARTNRYFSDSSSMSSSSSSSNSYRSRHSISSSRYSPTKAKFDSLAYNVVMIGDSGVGKTSLINRMLENSHQINSDSKPSIIIRDDLGQKISLTINEFTEVSIEEQIAEADVVFLVFDVCNLSSFSNIPMWKDRIRSVLPHFNRMVLVGNKVDLADRRAVSPVAARELSIMYNVSYIEISAKLGFSPEDIWNSLACIDEPLVDCKTSSYCSGQVKDESVVAEEKSFGSGRSLDDKSQSKSDDSKPLPSGCVDHVRTSRTKQSELRQSPPNVGRRNHLMSLAGDCKMS